VRPGPRSLNSGRSRVGGLQLPNDRRIRTAKRRTLGIRSKNDELSPRMSMSICSEGHVEGTAKDAKDAKECLIEPRSGYIAAGA
jgi:hypothetical protein